MPRFSTKHPKREQTFKFNSFHDGLTKEMSAQHMTANHLENCVNMKYVLGKDAEGNKVVTLKQRQGVIKITNTALTSTMEACFYYEDQSQYIVATSSKVYYLDGSSDPVEIGSISGVPTFTEFKEKLIIHDSGVTKAWDGTTFETLNCLYEDELLGTGDNAETNFTGTFSNLTVQTSSITISFTDGTVKTITDDGAGALTGNVNAGGTNTINYTTGAYDFTCDGAPDTSTTITVDYEQVNGAPKSKAGMVRASRLYMWGDSDNTSRLWYSGVNDEDGWDSSSSGGSLDVDPDDGQTLIGVLNYFQSLVLVKEGNLHRLDNFPTDDTYRVEPLLNGIGSVAYRTLNDGGDLMTFLADSGWVAIRPSERYGDIQQEINMSKDFDSIAVRHANSSAYSEFNRTDNQMWLSLYDDENAGRLGVVYAVNLSTGGQLSLYNFVFEHSCFTWANNRMLIGATNGHLYYLDTKGSTFTDGGTSYSDKTKVKSAAVDWDLPGNRKHNKRLYVNIDGIVGLTANLKLYRNMSNNPFKTIPITLSAGDAYIGGAGRLVEIYDMGPIYIPFDYKKFTQTDSAGRLKVDSATQLTITALDNDEDTRLVNDWGVGSEVSGDYSRRLSFQLSGGSTNDGAHVWGMSNDGSYRVNDPSLSNGIMLRAVYFITGLVVTLVNTDPTDLDSTGMLTYTDRYYVDISRVGTTTTATIYSDSSFATVVDTLSVSEDTATQYRYEYGMSGYVSGDTGGSVTGVVYDLSRKSNAGNNSIYSASTDLSMLKRFNYKRIQWELTDISGTAGAEVLGVDFTGAIIGRK